MFQLRYHAGRVGCSKYGSYFSTVGDAIRGTLCMTIKMVLVISKRNFPSNEPSQHVKNIMCYKLLYFLALEAIPDSRNTGLAGPTSLPFNSLCDISRVHYQLFLTCFAQTSSRLPTSNTSERYSHNVASN
jgi:hypothetical protein